MFSQYSKLTYLCNESKDVLSLFGKPEGGKSGQLRAPHFLTGRSSTGNGRGTESAAEKYTAIWFCHVVRVKT